MLVFGDTLNTSLTFPQIKRILNYPVVHPRFRVSVLNYDESVRYEIPSMDIVPGGISYTEEYQNGQRRNFSLTLINKNGKYTPSINNDIWLHTKFRLDIGLETKTTTTWFPRGIYVMGDINTSNTPDGTATLEIQLKDKYAIFEGKLGTLGEAYEIQVGSNIEEVIKGVLNFDIGNGYILDYSPVILDPRFIGKITQNTIRVEEGQNIGAIIDNLATQLSAEYYYNAIGQLCFYPIEEAIGDRIKPIIWTFDDLYKPLQQASLNYNNEETINCVRVVGENIESGIYSATVENRNPRSPICVQQIGKRMAPVYRESSVWSNELAQDLANYYLRQSSFIQTSFSTECSFNPLLFVNNIVEAETPSTALNLHREKFLITSISFTSENGNMSLKLSNLEDLPGQL